MASCSISQDRFLNRDEAAAFLGVRSQTLSVWATTHRYNLPFVKIGRNVRYRMSDLEKFVELRTVNSGAE